MTLPPRLASVLLAIGCVAVATVGLRSTQPDVDARDYNVQIVPGRVGQAVHIRGGELEVTNVRFGSALAEYGEVSDRTAGMFVVLTIEASDTGTKDLQLTDSRLFSHEITYDSYGFPGGPLVNPGFRSTLDVAFEVDPDLIDDLTLDIYQSQLISGYAQHARISLGITAETAERWRASGRGRTLEVGKESRQGIG